MAKKKSKLNPGLVAVLVVFAILVVANGQVITRSTSTSTSSSTTTTTSSVSGSTTATWTSSLTTLPGNIQYPTAADELLNKGVVVMEFDMYFPTINLPVIVDAMMISSSCPCHLTSISQIGSTVVATSPNEENITIAPASGYELIKISAAETMSTAWNGSPTIRPSDVYQMWQTNYSLIRFGGVMIPANFFSADNVGFYAYSRAALTRGGVTYNGVGYYWRVTATSGYDPHPVANLTRFFGVIPTPTFMLSPQKLTYAGGQYGSAYVQDLSSVAYPDGSVYPVQITQTIISCSSETVSFVDPRSSATVSLTLNFITSQTSGCRDGHPAGELPYREGNGDYGWIHEW
jgi:hypothetical protein